MQQHKISINDCVDGLSNMVYGSVRRAHLSPFLKKRNAHTSLLSSTCDNHSSQVTNRLEKCLEEAVANKELESLSWIEETHRRCVCGGTLSLPRHSTASKISCDPTLDLTVYFETPRV